MIANTLGRPADAIAVTGNLTVMARPGGLRDLAPALTAAQPKTSTHQLPALGIRANGVTVPLAAGASSMSCTGRQDGRHGKRHFDVTGYFTND